MAFRSDASGLERCPIFLVIDPMPVAATAPQCSGVILDFGGPTPLGGSGRQPSRMQVMFQKTYSRCHAHDQGTVESSQVADCPPAGNTAQPESLVQVDKVDLYRAVIGDLADNVAAMQVAMIEAGVVHLRNLMGESIHQGPGLGIAGTLAHIGAK